MTWPRAKITNKSRLEERNCPYCKRFMGKKFLEKRLKEVQKQKSQKIKASIEERIKAGEQIGRKAKPFDESTAVILRKSGMSLRKISQKMGIGLMRIYRVVKDVKNETT